MAVIQSILFSSPLTAALNLKDLFFSFVFKNDKIVHEILPQPRQNLPSAKEMTSITFMGERRNHPSLRMRLYEVLQH